MRWSAAFPYDEGLRWWMVLDGWMHPDMDTQSCTWQWTACLMYCARTPAELSGMLTGRASASVQLTQSTDDTQPIHHGSNAPFLSQGGICGKDTPIKWRHHGQRSVLISSGVIGDAGLSDHCDDMRCNVSSRSGGTNTSTKSRVCSSVWGDVILMCINNGGQIMLQGLRVKYWLRGERRPIHVLTEGQICGNKHMQWHWNALSRALGIGSIHPQGINLTHWLRRS